MNLSEEDLIRRAQIGNPDAFCALAETYAARIYSLALHFCHDQRDAEDLSQEVWLKAYSSLATFKFESSFYTWLRKVLINSFLNHRRSRYFRWRLRTDELTADREDLIYVDSDEITFQNRLIIEKVMRALAEVTPRQRLIFLLKHHEGMTYEEISSTVGCSTGTAKKSIARTISKLRQRLGINQETAQNVTLHESKSKGHDYAQLQIVSE